MDDFVKHAPSYQLDQDILDARGINMTVEEVAGLSTGKYSQRVQALNLNENDLVFLKCLRRRIKNRVASQNSRRRSLEHLRRLTRELRVVRACRHDALCERRALVKTSTELRSRYAVLRSYIVQVLKDRSDPTSVPDLEMERLEESPSQKKIHEPTDTEVKTKNGKKEDLFECRIEKLVQQSVNHIFKEKSEKKIISAKTVFIDTKKLADVKSDLELKLEYDSLECPISDYQKLDFDKTKLDFDKTKLDLDKTKSCVVPEFSEPLSNLEGKKDFEEGGVLNLCVKERKSHGRKQLAPKRVTYVFTEYNDDGVIDFSIKKEEQ